MNKAYEVTYSPFQAFTREEWRKLEEHPMFPISEIDLSALQALNEPLTIDEVEDVYIPMIRLLQIHLTHYRNLHKERDQFFENTSHPIPYIIGIAGSVAAGKSTTARVLQKLLSMTPEQPRVELVTTDGFLYPNSELERRGILNRKGFPKATTPNDYSFLAAVKSVGATGSTSLLHLYYDVIPDKMQVISRPDILIVEGINVLQVSTGKKMRRVFVSDFFDFSIYVMPVRKTCASGTWNDLKLQQTAFQNPKSYFHQYASYPDEELMKFANQVWEEINSSIYRRTYSHPLPSRPDPKRENVICQRCPFGKSNKTPTRIIHSA